MTDPDLTPEQDAVRRLLASARHDEPVPEPVVARLEATLADLTADRRPTGGESEATAPVVDLSARRRRRAGAALMAAAAVVVAGVALGQGLGSGGDSMSADSEASDAGGEAGDSRGGTPFAEEEGDASLSAPDAESQAESELGSEDGGRADKRLPAPYAAALDSGIGLRRDLLSLRDAGLPLISGAEELAPAEEPACLTTDVGRGRTVWVTYDDSPAIAVFRSPSGGRQVAEVWLCGASSPERSIGLRAPGR